MKPSSLQVKESSVCFMDERLNVCLGRAVRTVHYGGGITQPDATYETGGKCQNKRSPS